MTGVDFRGPDRGHARVPQATFLCADMTTIAFPVGTFAAIVSFFAIIHLPVHEHRPLLERCFAWLSPGGYLLATVGYQAWTGYKDNWYGAPMYWSHADEATYRTWLQELGFGLLWSRLIPEGDGGHVLVCRVALPRNSLSAGVGLFRTSPVAMHAACCSPGRKGVGL